MLHYYRNPKTEDLIIWDSNANELLIIERIKNIRVFTEEDVKHPISDYGDKGKPKERPKKKRRSSKQISDEKIDQIREMKDQGASVKEIMDEVGVGSVTVYKYSK